MMKNIDLHTHILPDIDDGASTVDEALRMTDILYQQNVREAVCTPHFDPSQQSLQSFLNKRAVAIALMNKSKVTLIPASETVLHEYLFHYTDLHKLCIENTKYLLIELQHGEKWSVIEYETLKRLITYYDIIPIIAHVERYHSFLRGDKYIKKLKELGCVIQLNTASIIDKKSRHQAFCYMKRGYIDVLGSDCHNLKQRPPIITAAFNQIIRKLGVIYCNELKHNAECIVSAKDIRIRHPYIIN